MRDFGNKRDGRTRLRRGRGSRGTESIRPRRLTMEPLEPRRVLQGGPLISEFMAINDHGLKDEDGDRRDWVEIHNPTSAPIDLEGWYLTDNADNLTKWTFPPRSVAPGEYLVVFASNKDRTASELHTNFKLASDGEYLALVEPDGTTVAHAYTPRYPNQTADVSYGLAPGEAEVLVREGARVSLAVPTADDAALGTTWTEPGFDDASWSEFADFSPVLITEAATGAPDYVEIQNVSSEAVDTSGWVVAVNNPLPDYDINKAHPTYWHMDASIAAGEVLYRTNAPDDNFWGDEFVWSTQGPGWVMIVDEVGTVQDFVVWGYGRSSIDSFRTEVNGFTITAADIWKEDAVKAGGGRDNSLQRHGTADHDHASDWEFVVPQSKGAPNEDLTIGVPTSPTTGLGFSLPPSDFGDAVQTDVTGEMHGTNASLWTRIEFDVRDVANLNTLTLQMKYNDGFVAYLNGEKVATDNAPLTVAWNSAATGSRDVLESLEYELFDVSSYLGLLQPGANVLAIHGLNFAASDNDFLILPKLVAGNSRGPEDFFTTPTPGEPNVPRSVVINEIHYDPDVKTEPVEFIELHNAGAVSVDLSHWTLRGGISYDFPEGSSLGAGEYVVISIDPDALQAKYGVASLGPMIGRLNNDGETVVLRDTSGFKQDEVDYKLGFPWPTVGDAPGYSIELIHPLLDNGLGGNWRSSLAADGTAGPTPGAANSIFADNAPPQMRKVTHTPEMPASGEDVTVTMKVTDPDDVAGVTLAYQIVEPGDYINLADARYEDPAWWTTLPMVDDGSGSDVEAGDDVYTAVLPGTIQQNRRLIRYRVTATDDDGASVTAPYADDPQPNFAYYVYDGVPSWSGSARPGVEPVIEYSSEMLTSLPVYSLITKRQDHLNALSVPYRWGQPDQQRPTTSPDWSNLYKYPGALVYDGVVYDHVRYRPRGGVHRFKMGKNMWKFDFNRGHYFQAIDDYGNPYDVAWDKMNFSAIIQQGNFNQRGEQGLFEWAGFKLHNLSGNAAPNSSFVHFRIVEDGDEGGPDQFSTDFQGLYLTIEQPDGRLLDEHGLPDGNFYKMESGTGTLNNQGPTQPSNKSDLNAFMNGYKSNPNADWWRANVDLDDYYNFRAIAMAIHDYDMHAGKNYFYYHNPETDKWSVHNWDLDLCWSTTYNGGGGQGPLYDDSPSVHLLNIPELRLEYNNRVRELVDLLFNLEQTGMMLDECASFIYQPGQPSFADADAAVWDYNPIVTSSYINTSKTGPGWFYRNSVTPPGRFAGMVQREKLYVQNKVNGYLAGQDYAFDPKVASDEGQQPHTPTITYTGPAGYPIDELHFETSTFSSSQSTFAALQWRIAAVTDPNDPAFDPTLPRNYEITSTWQSDEIAALNTAMRIPGQDLDPDELYRVRVRMKDALGRWSHWSDPVQFVSSTPAGPTPDALLITEINYHPYEPTAAELAINGDFDKNAFEFIELTNTGGEALDLSYMELRGGIEYTFPPGTMLAAGERIVVVENPLAFEARYGADVNTIGPYDQRLNDGGELLSVLDVYDRTLFEFDYNDEGDWPGRADGKGATLVLADPDAVPTDALLRTDYMNRGENWMASVRYGGTPGEDAEPAVGVVVNEVLSHTDWPDVDTIELLNTTAGPIDVGGWYLSDQWGWDPTFATGNYKKYRIRTDKPSLTTIAPGGYISFSESDFNPTPLAPEPHHFALDAARGDEVWLMKADASGELTHFADLAEFGAQANAESWGRWPNATGRFYPMTEATSMADNSGPRLGSVVLSEVHYNPGTEAGADDLEFVEIHNTADATVGLANWRLRGEVDFNFTASTNLPSYGAIVVVAFDPLAEPEKLAAFKSHYNVSWPIRIVGPYANTLDDEHGRVRLQRPDEPPIEEPGFFPGLLEDEATYRNDTGWPIGADGRGDSLHRTDVDTWGNDVGSWTAAVPTPGEVSFVTSPHVAGRFVFYNNSPYSDPAAGGTDNAIAPDKAALLPGTASFAAGGTVASFANYTSFDRGINGLIIDLGSLPEGVTPSAANFEFRVGTDDQPDEWSPAPLPTDFTVREGEGTVGADRVTFTWADGAIRNQWLEVTVSGAALGLASDDVFYFGNAVAEAGDRTTHAQVTVADLLLA
ncbi:MAG: lamin tail domain-containing protein, partial [Candidatus Nealsonbacteria bacterium]|nr:lamin tail domain-containing protein [Candidatus Nealsonbacteria bacterium]